MTSTIHVGSVQRIKFGKDGVGGPVVSECGTPGYVLGLGERPKGARGFLRLVGPLVGGDTVYKQLSDKAPALRGHSIDLENGPYADRVAKDSGRGEIEIFRSEIFTRVQPTNIQGVADRVIDSVRPYHPQLDGAISRIFKSRFGFILNPDFITANTDRHDPSLALPDRLMCAGDIFTQPIRLVEDETSGATFVTVTGNIESLLLAVSALRRHGLSAYPAMAVNLDLDLQGQVVEVYAPLIAILDMTKDIPLHTFSPFMREHPHMVALDILSDIAMLGATCTTLAETRIKRLALEMRYHAQEFTGVMEDSEIEYQLSRVADALFQCHINWPNSHLILGTLDFALETIAGAIAFIETGQPLEVLKQIATTSPTTRSEISNLNTANVVLRFSYEISHRYNLFIREQLGQRMDSS
ncbi:MAG: hypothetical protein ABID61_06050 [Candidatus Micrarchaeota archaeon]